MSEVVCRASSGCFLGIAYQLRSRWGLSALRGSLKSSLFALWGANFVVGLPWGGGCIVLGVSIVYMGLT